MKIVPLGTSAGQATFERGVTGLAAFVGSATHWVLVDCGEGTQQKILSAKKAVHPGATELPWDTLGAILITHGHADHCFGLFSVLAALALTGRTKPLPLLAPPEVEVMVNTVMNGSHTHLTYPIEWVHPKDGLVVELGSELSCRCVQMEHRATSHGYLLESFKMLSKTDIKAFEAVGFKPGVELGVAIAAAKRGELSVLPNASGVVDLTDAIHFQSQKESLFVGGDNAEPKRIIQVAHGATAWVHEATYLHEDWEKNGAGLKWGHSSAQMVGEAARLGRPGALVLTHFSPRYSEGVKGLERLRTEASKYFDGPVHLATDLMPIEFLPLLEFCPRPRLSKRFKV